MNTTNTRTFHVMYNVGNSYGIVNWHDGEKTHNDGSRFYDTAIFKGKRKMQSFVNDLVRSGYVETPFRP